MEKYYDVVIVGAGPAGYGAAFELSSFSNLSLLVLDKGKRIGGRACQSLYSYCPNDSPCEVTHGSGGAGLFSDGKLFFDPKVGGDITKFYSESESADLMGRVIEMLSIDGNSLISKSENKDISNYFGKEFNGIGLDFAYNDVVRTSLSERISKTAALEDYLYSRNVYLSFENAAKNIVVDGKEFHIDTDKGMIRSKYLIVAPGKVGSNWFSNIYSRLGVESVNNPLYIGVRLETDGIVTQDMLALTDNPKISRLFPNGNYVKTHCFSNRGRVVIANYDGLKVIDGNFLEDRISDNVAVNIVMKLNLPEHVDPFQFSSRFISQVNDFGAGKPVIQRLDDLRNFSVSNPERMIDSSITPTLSDCRQGDLSQLYPLRFENILQFLDLADKVLPGFAFPDNLIYGPFVEWWMKKVKTDKFFETSVSNLYAVGDGAGMSQGITAAAMQGIASARGIIRKEDN